MEDLKQIESHYPGHSTATLHVRGIPVATASIDELADFWWVSRVFVKKEYRGKGLGSRCLKRAVELVRLQNKKPVIVSPEGYDTPLEAQQSFYEENGFVKGPEGMRFQG